MPSNTQRTGVRWDITIAAVIFAVLVAIAVVMHVPTLLVGSISRSHVEGNVPDNAEFARFLSRDLHAHFRAAMKTDVDVSFELLRDGATQVGLSYPKFYVWVVVTSRATGVELAKGAVTVAAQEKELFVVTDYISRFDISAHPERLRTLPGPVVDRIRSRF
jgi:hypothetical protein